VNDLCEAYVYVLITYFDISLRVLKTTVNITQRMELQ